MKELRSDIGSNIVGADREIKEAIEHIDDEKVRSELLQRGCISGCSTLREHPTCLKYGKDL